MKKLIIIILSLSIGLSSLATITITIVSPSNNQVVNTEQFLVQVTIISSYDIASATAKIGTIQKALVFNGQYFVANFSMSVFTQDSLLLEVTATDVFNNQQSTSRQFIYDLAPILNVVKPLLESVARPNIDVKIKNIDIDTCMLLIQVQNLSGIVLQTLETVSIVDSFQNNYSLLAQNGLSVIIKFTVTDKRGSATARQILIYVTTKPFLEEIFEAKDPIRDFNYNKIFTYFNGITNDKVDTSTISNPFPKIINISGSGQTQIPVTSYKQSNGALTPFGAVFIDKPSGANFNTIEDWNNGALYPIYEEPQKIMVKGNYLAWFKNAYDLFRRDMSTKSNILISPLPNAFDLTDTGAIAYQKTPNIYTYKNGITTQITNDNISINRNENPQISGNYIAYVKYNVNTFSRKLYLFDGQSHVVLTDWGVSGGSLTPPAFYQVNNKFVVYTKINFAMGGIKRFWLRDSLGNDTQISFSGNTNTNIIALNRKGDVWFRADDSLYLRLYNGQVFTFHYFNTINSWGIPYYRDTSWYLNIGRMLYRIKTEGNSIQLCPPFSSLSLTSNISGTSYQWQKSTSYGVFSNITDDINCSGSNTSTLQLNNIPSSWNQYQFRCFVNGFYSDPFTILFINSWTGTQNTAWENPVNWSCGFLPDDNTDVVITSGTVVINSNITIRSLKISPGASLVINSGFVLTVLH